MSKRAHVNMGSASTSPRVFLGGVPDAVWVGTVLAPWLSIDELERGFARTCRRGLEWARRAQALVRHWSVRVPHAWETGLLGANPWFRGGIRWPPAKQCSHLRLKSLVVARAGPPLTLSQEDYASLNAIVCASASTLVHLDVTGVLRNDVNEWPPLPRLRRLAIRFAAILGGIKVSMPALSELDTNYALGFFACPLRILRWSVADTSMSRSLTGMLEYMIDRREIAGHCDMMEEVHLVANARSFTGALAPRVRKLPDGHSALRVLSLEHRMDEDSDDDDDDTRWSGRFLFDRRASCLQMHEGADGVHRDWLEWLPPVAHLDLRLSETPEWLRPEEMAVHLQRIAPERLGLDLDIATALPMTAFATVKHVALHVSSVWRRKYTGVDFVWLHELHELHERAPTLEDVSFQSYLVDASLCPSSGPELVKFLEGLPRLRLGALLGGERWWATWAAASPRVTIMRPADVYVCRCRQTRDESVCRSVLHA